MHNQVTIRHLPVNQQVTGAFDGGAITENKPIGFPQEFPRIRAVGPLLYWAWAKSESGGLIGLHPHRGFEIMSYCLSGEMVHRDSTGNLSTVVAGGIQVMQTGSGVSHEEGLSEGGQFFQIWFHPELEKTLRQPAKYHEFANEEFQVDTVENGVEIKRVLGPDGALQLQTQAIVDEVRLPTGGSWQTSVGPGWALAAVAISGSPVWLSGGDRVPVETGDLAVVESANQGTIRLEAGTGASRVLTVRVPQEVGYRLHI